MTGLRNTEREREREEGRARDAERGERLVIKAENLFMKVCWFIWKAVILFSCTYLFISQKKPLV